MGRSAPMGAPAPSMGPPQNRGSGGPDSQGGPPQNRGPPPMGGPAQMARGGPPQNRGPGGLGPPPGRGPCGPPPSNTASSSLFAFPKEESKEVLKQTKQSITNLFPDPKPVIVAAAPSRPSLVTVLQGQTSDGNWTVESRAILANCV